MVMQSRQIFLLGKLWGNYLRALVDEHGDAESVALDPPFRKIPNIALSLSLSLSLSHTHTQMIASPCTNLGANSRSRPLGDVWAFLEEFALEATWIFGGVCVCMCVCVFVCVCVYVCVCVVMHIHICANSMVIHIQICANSRSRPPWRRVAIPSGLFPLSHTLSLSLTLSPPPLHTHGLTYLPLSHKHTHTNTQTHKHTHTHTHTHTGGKTDSGNFISSSLFQTCNPPPPPSALFTFLGGGQGPQTNIIYLPFGVRYRKEISKVVRKKLNYSKVVLLHMLTFIQ